MTTFSDDLSRRSFIRTALAGTGASLIAVEAEGKKEGHEPPKRSSASQDGELTSLSLRDAAELVRKKKVSPVELTQACLARIERLNPSLNAFITVTAESALAQAREAEAEVQRGKWRGPLHGIPIALKDLFDTAGVRTTAGSALFQDRVPTEDAETVRRLKAAGAVLAGKTNLHEFAYGGTCVVTHFGTVHNPWELSHIAGGSSGGSAVGLAAELFYGALGTDTAGSVRIPAAFCGIVGLKPTYGLVSTRGVIPLSWSLDHAGPMARTVADTALLLQAIAGYDPQEITSERMNIPDYTAALRLKTSSMRIGVPREFFFAGLDPEIEAATNRALSVLEKLTAGLRDVTISASGQERLRSAVRAAEAWAYHADFVAKSPELYQPETLTRLRMGADINTVTYIQGRRELAQTRREIGHVFETVDVLVTPAIPIPPPTIAAVSRDVSASMEISSRTIRNTSPFDVYGWPAISIPCGFTSAGLPIGIQISGPLGRDAVVLQLAHAYEEATDWHKRRPTLAT